MMAAADRLFVERRANYLLIGMWINARLFADKLAPGKDYAVGKFPALGLGHDDASLLTEGGPGHKHRKQSEG